MKRRNLSQIQKQRLQVASIKNNFDPNSNASTRRGNNQNVSYDESIMSIYSPDKVVAE